MAEISDLASLDASNTARFPEGQIIPSLNDGARALEGILARWSKDTSAVTATQGNGSAYQMLTQRAVPALTAGMVFMFRAHVACLAGPTFQLNALTAKPLKRQGGAALVAGDILVNQIVMAVYNSATDTFECLGLGTPSRLTGTATFAAATTVAVTGLTQPDTSYFIDIEPNGNFTFWPTSKTVNGFTINCSASQSGIVAWRLTR